MHASLSPNRGSGSHSGSGLGPSQRLVAVDILRYFSFLAILFFHMSFALWAPLGLIDVPTQSWSGHAIEFYARAFSFSGFTVLFLSFFLFGFRGRENRKFARLPIYILCFAIVWTATVEEFPYWWDIYPFLLVALVLLVAVKKIPAGALAVISGTVVSIPFWNSEFILSTPAWLTTIAVGICSTRGDLGDWPLLPWVAYPLFAFAIGKLTFQNRDKLSRISRGEALVWILALTGCASQIGKYYVTTIGENFGCFVFRQEPLAFWAHQIPIFFLLRISFLKPAREWLEQQPIARWFSTRPVNRYFFLIYFIHYPLAHLIAAIVNRAGLTLHPYSLSIACLSLVAAVEGGPVVIARILQHNKFKGWALWQRINAK